MGLLKQLLYFSVHPQELRSIIQWKLWHDPVHERDPSKETPTLRECYKYLDLTSRSFSAVIKELNPELLVPVALFYLALRALDTIEDDMTLSLATKEPLLRDFHNVLEKDGWTFDGSGPNEKDRDLLVHFDCVVTEFKKIKPVYKTIIKEITKEMGNGMADYATNEEHNTNGINTVAEYELYCHYVAGVVGHGLTRLFVESGLANPALLERPELTESMGQFLQKTNIIRDVREDFDEKRQFYPKEIWSKHVTRFDDLFLPQNIQLALNVSSDMVLNALKHMDDCLFYMAGIKDQSVFNFVAIPQSMAIATLELVFMNPAVFERNIKITKGDACELMMQSSQNLRIVCGVFKRYARRISKKNSPKNPKFLEISIACAKVEKFIESIFPSQDAGAVASDYNIDLQAPVAVAPKSDKQSKKDLCYIMLASAGTMLLITGMMLGVAWAAGARFDLAFSDLFSGNSFPGFPGAVTTISNTPAPSILHNDL